MRRVPRGVLAAWAMIVVALLVPARAHGEVQQQHAGTHHEESGGSTGHAGNPGKVKRTIDVAMSDDMRFAPSVITVRRGETVRFRVKNTGVVAHEMVLGRLHDLEAHAKAMRDNPAMRHADPNQVTVAPGKIGELVWQFTQPGTFDFACLEPGHFEAGMRGRIVVRP